jgi:aspartyl-tRNA(Asn)/glutamyl-tRNA(Gln) amidotransferase subunit B
LKQTLQYLDVSDCDMEKGSLRVDANVSVRPRAETRLGTKTELKNMNSFSNVERALVYEIDRQVEQRSRGQAIEQQTLLWDESRSMARPMRSKEESHDYRYFPDPDLPPVVLEHGFVGAIRETLPERPAQREKRIVSEFGIPAYDASVLCADRGVADYFERVAVAAGDGKAASNWVMTDVLAWCRQESADIHAFPITAERLADLIRLTMDGTLSSNLARSTFQEMTVSCRAASEIVREKGWVQVRDDDQLERWVHVVLAQHPAEIQRYRDGDTKLLGFFMGRVMQASEGKADPRRVSAMLRERLS